MEARGKTEKVSVTLPGELARLIRSTVPPGEVSSFVAEALEHYLAYRKQKVALEKGFGAWKDAAHPDLTTPQDSSAYVHGIREADKKRLDRLGGVIAE
ncbi:MAG: hypothetical protein HYX85_00585 [Chloroflexi bacterium]|nr:hypothetical protein [Chloroflexota bacterium]